MKVRTSRAGFSLIELVLVMFLTGIILLVVGRLCQRSFDTLRVLQEKAQTIQAATLGLERLGSELRETIGTVVAGSSIVTFTKVDPAAPYVLNNDGDPVANPADPPLGADFEKFATNYALDASNDPQLGTVTYERQASDQILLRTAAKGAKSMSTQVATHVNAFTVVPNPNLQGRPTANNVFLVTLSLQEQRRVYTFTSVVICPGVAP